MPQGVIDDALRNAMAQQALLKALGDMKPVPSHPSEDEFRRWYAGARQRFGHMAPDPDDPEQHYDFRAAYAAGILEPGPPDERGERHWPSTFKPESHPNIVVGGFHTKTGKRVPGTSQASEQELIRLGWDPEFARRVSRK